MKSTKHFFLYFTLLISRTKLKTNVFLGTITPSQPSLFFLGAKNFAQQKQKSIPEATFQFLISSRRFNSVFFLIIRHLIPTELHAFCC